MRTRNAWVRRSNPRGGSIMLPQVTDLYRHRTHNVKGSAALHHRSVKNPRVGLGRRPSLCRWINVQQTGMIRHLNGRPCV
jgi:hypothetical protein